MFDARFYAEGFLKLIVFRLNGHIDAFSLYYSYLCHCPHKKGPENIILIPNK